MQGCFHVLLPLSAQTLVRAEKLDSDKFPAPWLVALRRQRPRAGGFGLNDTGPKAPVPGPTPRWPIAPPGSSWSLPCRRPYQACPVCEG